MCDCRSPIGNSRWQLKDLLGDARYDWDGKDLQERELYFDERPWSARVFCAGKGMTNERRRMSVE
jgi:hypothetical protein